MLEMTSDTVEIVEKIATIEGKSKAAVMIDIVNFFMNNESNQVMEALNGCAEGHYTVDCNTAGGPRSVIQHPM